MNKYLLALILLFAGAWLIYSGRRREGSIAGLAETLGKGMANAIDGRIRVPEHMLCYTAGGLLLAAGAMLALRGEKI